MSEETWVDWTALEENIPLDELPSFHRAFLQLARPDSEEDWDNTFLRKVQSRVQATLKQLEREDRVKVEDGRYLVPKDLIPEAFRHHLN